MSRREKALILIVLFVGLTMQNILWFAPSPFLSLIVEDLGISMAQAGLSMSVIGLITAVSGLFLGEFFVRIGIQKTFATALLLMAAGSALNALVDGFTMLMVSRILIGVGFGFCLPVAGSVIMGHFSAKTRPYLNTFNSLLPYVATTLTFLCTIPLYRLLGRSWRWTLVVPGVFAVFALWCWVRVFPATSPAAVDAGRRMEGRMLRELLRNREVRLLTIAESCDMWSFQFVTTYLATFFHTQAHMTLEASSQLMAIFPVAGIFGGLSCGFAMGRIGLRKPFTWPLHILIFVGTTLALFGVGWIRMIGVFLSGFGNAGWAPALYTMPMEFRGMTPERVGSVYALMLSAGFFAAFLSPVFGGALSEFASLRNVLFLFSTPSLLAAWCTFRMEETGTAKGALSACQAKGR